MNQTPTDIAKSQAAYITNLITSIGSTKERLRQAELFLAALEMRAGQNCASITICGQLVDLTVLGLDFMPKQNPAMAELRAAVIKHQTREIIRLRSQLEGLGYQLKREAKKVAG
jgi:hypothetical protein